MVFSLFRRQDKADTRKGKGAGSVAAPTSSNASNSSAFKASDGRGGNGAPTVDAEHAAREAARRTAEKIDQIENEIIADALTDITPTGGGVAVAEPQTSVEPPIEAERVAAATADMPAGSKPTAIELLQALNDKEDGIESSFNVGNGVPTHAETVDVNATAAMPTKASPDSIADLEFVSPTSMIAGPATAGATTAGGRRANEVEDDLAIDIVDGSLPPQLEEAAILYSNSQYNATADTLIGALEDNELSHPHQILAWQMLFDLYQVMGARDEFDSLAIRYASLTESSPPTWNDALRAPDKRKNNDRRSSPSSIIAPRELDGTFAKFVDQLIRAAGNKRECSLDLSGVRQMDADSALEVHRLISRFSELDYPIALNGVESFFELVTEHIEVGRLDETEYFWQLTLLLLRLMGEQARFDDLSIDYCVTFEVSPPPWEALPGKFKMADEIASTPATADKGGEPGARSVEVVNSRLMLKGELTGKIEEERAAMAKVAESNSTVRLDCRALRIMDFTAAGEMLNELASMMARGRKVQFIEPNFLVYALMLVMGIHEMSEIRRRKI
ncbi:MAG: hypothetical protein AB8C46_24695 [Burkholderiaceae bacterium]